MQEIIPYLVSGGVGGALGFVLLKRNYKKAIDSDIVKIDAMLDEKADKMCEAVFGISQNQRKELESIARSQRVEFESFCPGLRQDVKRLDGALLNYEKCLRTAEGNSKEALEAAGALSEQLEGHKHPDIQGLRKRLDATIGKDEFNQAREEIFQRLESLEGLNAEIRKIPRISPESLDYLRRQVKVEQIRRQKVELKKEERELKKEAPEDYEDSKSEEILQTLNERGP